MRRLFLVLMLSLVAAGALAWLLRADPGYVLMQYRATRVETTLWFALLALAALLPAFYYLGRLAMLLLDGLLRLGGRGRAAGGGLRLGRDRTARGLQAFFEGHWAQAARLLARGAARSPHPQLNYLLAARAAAASGDAELARGFLALCEAIPGSAGAVRIETARLQARCGEHAAALATLDDGTAVDAPAATGLRLEILPRTGDWARVGALLPQARRERALPEDTLDALEQRAFLALVDRGDGDAQALRRLWDPLPARLRERPALVAAYALGLARRGAPDDAAKALDGALARGWAPELVDALGLLPAKDPARRFTRAEGMLARHPDDPALLLALGRLALAAKLWGKARDYLESSLAREARKDTCLELARCYDQLGETAHAHRLRERALAL